MELAFTKMHGLGNDFVVIDAVSQPVELTTAQARLLADRRFGIGCDQILIVEPPPLDDGSQADVDFRYRIYNADGGEVEQCGNGARCFVRFVHEHGLTDKKAIRVLTASGIIEPQLLANGEVRVDMGEPVLAPPEIPFTAAAQQAVYTIEVDGQPLKLGVVSMGNPHAVLQVDDVDAAPVEGLGSQLQADARFPNSVNVGFMELRGRDAIALRVFERGSGETLACGTGACAAVVAGRVQGLLDEQVRVQLRGGELHISWAGPSAPVIMSGPATSVFEGRIDLDAVTTAAP